MLLHVIEKVERMHAESAQQRDEWRSAAVAEALARCLQELRAIVAIEARREARQRPSLRVV
jgi:hypothetical protein